MHLCLKTNIMRSMVETLHLDSDETPGIRRITRIQSDK